VGKTSATHQKRRRHLTPPGIKHWHGASPQSSLTHIAIQEMLNGKNVDWLEKVSEEQYSTSI